MSNATNDTETATESGGETETENEWASDDLLARPLFSGAAQTPPDAFVGDVGVRLVPRETSVEVQLVDSGRTDPVRATATRKPRFLFDDSVGSHIQQVAANLDEGHREKHRLDESAREALKEELRTALSVLQLDATDGDGDPKDEYAEALRSPGSKKLVDLIEGVVWWAAESGDNRWDIEIQCPPDSDRESGVYTLKLDDGGLNGDMSQFASAYFAKFGEFFPLEDDDEWDALRTTLVDMKETQEPEQNIALETGIGTLKRYVSTRLTIKDDRRALTNAGETDVIACYEPDYKDTGRDAVLVPSAQVLKFLDDQNLDTNTVSSAELRARGIMVRRTEQIRTDADNNRESVWPFDAEKMGVDSADVIPYTTADDDGDDDGGSHDGDGGAPSTGAASAANRIGMSRTATAAGSAETTSSSGELDSETDADSDSTAEGVGDSKNVGEDGADVSAGDEDDDWFDAADATDDHRAVLDVVEAVADEHSGGATPDAVVGRAARTIDRTPDAVETLLDDLRNGGFVYDQGNRRVGFCRPLDDADAGSQDDATKRVASGDDEAEVEQGQAATNGGEPR